MSVDLIASLDMMWKGMLGLFIVCGFIAVLFMAISRAARHTKTPGL